MRSFFIYSVCIFQFAFQLSVNGQQTSSYWPSLATAPTSSTFNSSGVLLSDGTLFSTAYSSESLSYFAKTKPDGRTIKYGTFSFGLSVHYLKYDDKEQRIFGSNMYYANEAIHMQPWGDTNFVNGGGSFYNRDQLLVCLDTAGNLVWVRNFKSPKDSIGIVSLIEPDGTGGIFVAGRVTGSISKAIRSTAPNDIYRRLESGYSFITRFDKTGVQKWTLKLPDIAKPTSYLATGAMLFGTRPKYAVDWLIYYADTNSQYYRIDRSGVTTNWFQIRRARIDTNGNVSNSFLGNMTGDYFPENNLSKFPLEHQDYGNKKRDLLFVNNVFESNTGILEFDTNYILTKAFKVLLPWFYGGDIAILPNGKIAQESHEYNVVSKKIFYTLEPENYQIETYHYQLLNCMAHVNGGSPHTFVLKRDNTSNAFDLLRFGSPINFNIPWFRFKDGTEPPCRGVFEENAPYPLTQDVTSSISLNWQTGNWSVIKSKTKFWTDTILTPTTFQPTAPLLDLCKNYASPLLGKDTTLCADSYKIRLRNYSGLYKWSTGARDTNTIEVNQSGTYAVQNYDTCGFYPTYVDSIKVVLLEKPNLQLEIDRINLCPATQKIVGVNVVPGLDYAWSPASLLQGSTTAKATFIADLIPKGENRFVIKGSYKGKCESSDTLMVYNSTGPTAQIEPEKPDDILVLNPSMAQMEWSLNGGIIEKGKTSDSLFVKWGPFFEGQQASIRIADGYDCFNNLVYIRTKPTEEPEPEMPEPIPLYFPNLITANSDSKNDLFEIKNIEPEDLVEAEIYDRWGNLVFKQAGYSNQFPSSKDESGLYFCILKVQYIRKGKLLNASFKSWITVLK